MKKLVFTLCVAGLVWSCGSGTENNTSDSLPQSETPSEGNNVTKPISESDEVNQASDRDENTHGSAGDTDLKTKIAFIRKKFEEITSAEQSYRVDSFNVECGGGVQTLIRKYEGNQLKILFEQGCSDHGCSGTTYYFWDDQLIFAFNQNSAWVGNTDEMSEYRTYYDNEKPIKCLEKRVSSTGGYEGLESLLSDTPNKEVDCGTEDEMQAIRNLVGLDLQDAERYYCE